MHREHSFATWRTGLKNALKVTAITERERTVWAPRSRFPV